MIAGLAGMRERHGFGRSVPGCPTALRRIAFLLAFRGRRPRLEITPGSATYSLRSGTALQVEHWGEPLTIGGGAAPEAAIPPAGPVPAPAPAAGPRAAAPPPAAQRPRRS